MNEFVSWASLGTYAGAVMMVTIIVQFLKQTPLVKVNAQLLAYLVAEAVNGSAITWQGAALCVLNAFIVALAAGGVYDAATIKKKAEEVGYVHEEIEDA